MTGGIINISNPGGNAAAANGGIMIGSSSYTVTGGTINITIPSSAVNFNINSTAPFWDVNIQQLGAGTGNVTIADQPNSTGNGVSDPVLAKPLVVLHDLTLITGNTIAVKNLAEGTSFITLDGKERKLSSADLMICNAESGMCIGGVFGGAESGVKETTTHIFLESAWFNPADIRRTSFRHGLRTDAATHFEKGVDISNTVQVLKRAALLIKEIAGGEISSDIVDVYPAPKEKTEIALKNHYLKKLSGKNYHPDSIKKILEALGFEITRENIDELRVAVPFSKPDITLPADIVEEIMRIDGLDNIDILNRIELYHGEHLLIFHQCLQQQWMLTTTVNNRASFL